MSQGPSMSQHQRYTQFEDSVVFDLDLKLTEVATERVGKIRIRNPTLNLRHTQASGKLG